MSFILDALKKSETERQRSSGPALFEAKVAPPQSRLPAWALIVGALLAVNLLILMWVLLRRDKAPAAAPPVAATASTAAVSPAAASPAVVSSSAIADAPGAALAGGALPSASPQIAAPPLAANSRPGRNAGAAADPGESFDTGVNPNDERPAVLPGSAEAIAAQRERARAQREVEEDAARVRQQMQATAGTPRREPALSARTAGLPTRDELVNSGRARIPELTLSLHAYDPDPARRFVFINGSRAREGDAVAGGVVLEAITRDGAILSSGGQKFVLTVQ